MADEKKKKKKSDVRVDSGETAKEVVSEHSSMKNEKKMKKQKNREIKDDFAGEDGEIAERESEKSGEDAFVKNKKSEKQRIDSEAEDALKKKKSKKKFKEAKADPEAEDGVKKSKKKIKETKVDSEAEDGAKKKKKKKKKKKSKKESGSDVIGNSESSKVCEEPPVHTDDANKKKGKRKREDTDLGAEENTDKEVKRKIKKKKKPSVDSEVEETTSDTKKKSKEEKTSEDSEVKDNNKDSTKDSKKKKKKKEKKQSVDSEVDDNNLNSVKDVKKKTKEKRLSEDSEVEENNKDSTKDAKTKQSVDSEAEENGLNSTKDAKKKRKKKKKKQSEVSESEVNNNDSKDAKKKRKKKQESGMSDKDVTTPSSKSTKRVKFSDQVEFFPAEYEDTEEKDDKEVKVVNGKRYTKEEDELVKNAVLEYIDNHALGDEGLKMVMECKSHPQLKGCWKEIASALPWRTHESVYNRAHTIFETGSKGIWTKEDMELIIEFQKKHGNDWKTLADAMGKHRKHVKDAWRRIRLAAKNKGHWKREEYQNLFDLVNKDLRMKAFQEKHAKHGMLRDNIPWMAISDVLGTRDHVTCCQKWYEQLTSPMVEKGIWANVDDYRLLEELLKLDAACIDDVDWDYLLENRDGEACRRRWNQMILHIGVPKSKTFAEQVEILSERYCPDIAEDREDFDNRPYDPKD